MKVVTAKQMAEIEKVAYKAGSQEKQFMEAAGKGVASQAKRFVDKHRVSRNIILLCGKGNNGGDAYVAGFYLLQEGYRVAAFQLGSSDSSTDLLLKNRKRFVDNGGVVHQVEKGSDVHFPADGLVIDALFGTGLNAAPREPYASVIAAANRSQLPILSVDIPSGLNGDDGNVPGEAIKATETLFLGLPKLGFFLQDGWNCVSRLRYVNFDLPDSAHQDADCEFELFTEGIFRQRMPLLKPNRHKYQAGYVVGLAGSPGMPGAANLSSSAALRGGAGIMRLLHPAGMEAELSASMYELIKTPYVLDHDEEVLIQMNRATACFIGPGIGVNTDMQALLRKLLPAIEKPTVIDADALTMISREAVVLPKQTILTPHMGEMRRLLHMEEPMPLDRAFLQQCADYAEKEGVTLILKGAPTFIFEKGKSITINGYGDPGMATAGSGDVLTGLIAALLAQGLSTYDAATCGAYIHARAGECAAEEKTSYCMTAGDITEHFSTIFGHLNETA